MRIDWNGIFHSKLYFQSCRGLQLASISTCCTLISFSPSVLWRSCCSCCRTSTAYFAACVWKCYAPRPTYAPPSIWSSKTRDCMICSHIGMLVTCSIFHFYLKECCCHRDEPIQTAALKLVQGMVQHQTLSNEQLKSLLPLVTKFGSHSSETCRLVMYETLIVAYSNILWGTLSFSLSPFSLSPLILSSISVSLLSPSPLSLPLLSLSLLSLSHSLSPSLIWDSLSSFASSLSLSHLSYFYPCILCCREAEGDSPSEEDVKTLLHSIRDQLLQGLSDDAEAIR